MRSRSYSLEKNLIDNEKNIAFWDRTAERFGAGSAAYAGMLMDGSEFEAIYRIEAEQARFQTLFNCEPTSRVLEVGSGGGRWALFLAERIASYVGLDISPKMIAIAEAECARCGLANARFSCTSLLDYTCAEQFDLIFFSGVLQYMDDDVVSAAITKAVRMLAPGGVIISRDSVQLEERVEKAGDYPVIYRTPDEYRDFFSVAGFDRTYMDVSYPAKRFTNVASRLYRLPGVTYSMAYAVRAGLCAIDDLLGQPDFLKTDLLKRQLRQRNPQEHRFFKYVRK